MTETVALFGAQGSLVGIHNDGGSTDANSVCCLLINAGVVSRVGPNRLNVKISRALAQRGIPSLRFDLAGLGDSKPSAGSVSYLEQASLDIRAAMDFVQAASGVRRFAIFGICSGAVNALGAALADERVAGILMLDGFWYRSRWSEPMRLWKRFRSKSLREMWAAVRRRFRATETVSGGGAEAADLFSVDGSGNPPIETFARDLNAVTERGVDVFFLYTGSVPEQVSYESQLRHVFSGEPFIKRVRCELHDDLDHTAVPLHAQRKLLGLIGDWVQGVRAR
jgi:pimeloyl-ACP methyl ester carboxylesterase